MKKATVRFLSMIIALCMLVTPAMAEAGLTLPEKNMASLTVGNFQATIDGQELSLPLYVGLTAGADIETGRGLLVAELATAEQTAASVYAVYEDNQIKAYVDGMEYGFFLPMEEILDMLQAELGAALTDFTAQIPEEMQTAIADMMDAAMALEAAGEVDPAAVLAALNLTIEEGGTAEVEIFDETVTADMISFTMEDQTLSSLMEGLSAAIPAFDAYWDSYTQLFTTIAEQSGEEMDVTLEEALEMVTMGAYAEMYTADNDMQFNIMLNMTVEGETIELPFMISLSETEEETRVLFSMSMEVDGETMIIAVEAIDQYVEDGYDNETIISMYIMDTDSEDVEGGFELNMVSFGDDDGGYDAVDMLLVDYDDVISMGFNYASEPVVITEDGAESYNGLLGLYAFDDYTDIEVYMNTNLTLSTVPEGELLVLPEGSINLIEMTDEQMEAVEGDIMIPLMQAMSVLMQDPALSELLASAM